MAALTQLEGRGLTQIVLHAPAAVERIAVESLLARHPRFGLTVRSVLQERAQGAQRGADVLVWVGDGFSRRPPTGTTTQQTRVLVVLRDVSATKAVSSLRSGAAGLTCLGCHLDDLPRAVDAIAAGQGWLSPCLARIVADHLAGRSRLHSAESGSLTPRELLVLRSIACGADNTQVARTLGIDTRTVRFHVSNIYRKLGARHRAEAVAMAYRLGLAA